MKLLYGILLSLFVTACTSVSSQRFEPDNLFSGMRPLHYLSDTLYDKMIIEVIQVEGAAPLPGDLDALLATAKKYCKKPQGITIITDSIIPRSEVTIQRWKNDDIFQMENKYAKYRTGGKTVVLHYLYVHGVYYDNWQQTAAVTIGPETVAFFYDLYGRYGSHESNIIACHEFGHILGLVNSGTPAIRDEHIDPNNKVHCRNIKCVMYFMSGFADQSTEYDDYCQEDLRRGATFLGTPK